MIAKYLINMHILPCILAASSTLLFLKGHLAVSLSLAGILILVLAGAISIHRREIGFAARLLLALQTYADSTNWTEGNGYILAQRAIKNLPKPSRGSIQSTFKMEQK